MIFWISKTATAGWWAADGGRLGGGGPGRRAGRHVDERASKQPCSHAMQAQKAVVQFSRGAT